MASFKQGDLAVLISGSPKMAVESVDGDTVSVVWCVEGAVARDSFSGVLLKKWEHREDGDDRGKRGGRPGGHRDSGPRDSGPPKGKTGWHGKPRDKNHFRKD